MNVIDTSVATWLRAKKTADIRAKALINLIVERSVMNKFLIDTLEGKEPIDSANIMCIGAAGDAWQQTSKALLKKYDVVSIDEDGWMVCRPRPENEVQFYIATEDGYIQGQWGETVDGRANLQWVNAGDAIARQSDDHADQWCVRAVLFKNTYSILGEQE